MQIIVLQGIPDSGKTTTLGILWALDYKRRWKLYKSTTFRWRSK